MTAVVAGVIVVVDVVVVLAEVGITIVLEVVVLEELEAVVGG